MIQRRLSICSIVIDGPAGQSFSLEMRVKEAVVVGVDAKVGARSAVMQSMRMAERGSRLEAGGMGSPVADQSIELIAENKP